MQLDRQDGGHIGGHQNPPALEMKSAYLLLGLPGNASQEDIDIAYARAAALFPPQRLASEDGAVDRFNELKTAYTVLCDPESRAAHDRKLAAAREPARARAPQLVVAAEANELSSLRKFTLWGLLAIAVLLGAGFYVSARNAETRRVQAALQLAKQQQAQREEQERAKEAERLEAERAAAQAKQQADEKRFLAESQQVARAAALERERQERLAQAAQRTSEAQARSEEQRVRFEEQRRANEARMQVERDKRSVRELCWQLYRRSDC